MSQQHFVDRVANREVRFGIVGHDECRAVVSFRAHVHNVGVPRIVFAFNQFVFRRRIAAATWKNVEFVESDESIEAIPRSRPTRPRNERVPERLLIGRTCARGASASGAVAAATTDRTASLVRRVDS
ncbi:MAG: hypothetical protein H0V50_07800 [Thermoleophilaceae bacterium]|nr:hypothetical protein [Thermoleophilaceae bacterium]